MHRMLQMDPSGTTQGLTVTPTTTADPRTDLPTPSPPHLYISTSMDFRDGSDIFGDT
jgi:hypothetical protein